MSAEGELVSEQPGTSIAEYSETAAAVARLRDEYKGVLFEVTTTAGDKAARGVRKQFVTLRTSLDKRRLTLNAEDRGRIEKRNSEAQRITEEILALERPIDDQITAEETRKETERQAKIDAEIKRVADLQERLTELRGNQTLSATSGAALIAEHIADLERIAIDESFQEFQQQATDAKGGGLARLQIIRTAAIAYEAEQARIKAEREELARLRAEQAARDAAAKKLRDEEDARLATERAELTRQQDELRKAQEPPKPTVTRRGIAVKIPSAAEMIDVLAKHYKAHPDTIIDWLRQTDFAQVQAA